MPHTTKASTQRYYYQWDVATKRWAAYDRHFTSHKGEPLPICHSTSRYFIKHIIIALNSYSAPQQEE